MTKLYVGNLPWSVDDQQLGELFSQAGEVTSARVIIDRARNRSKGFGFVEFANDADAQKAIEMFHEYDMDGRNLVVNEARPMEPRQDNRGGGGFHRN